MSLSVQDIVSELGKFATEKTSLFLDDPLKVQGPTLYRWEVIDKCSGKSFFSFLQRVERYIDRSFYWYPLRRIHSFVLPHQDIQSCIRNSFPFLKHLQSLRDAYRPYWSSTNFNTSAVVIVSLRNSSKNVSHAKDWPPWKNKQKKHIFYFDSNWTFTGAQIVANYKLSDLRTLLFENSPPILERERNKSRYGMFPVLL